MIVRVERIEVICEMIGGMCGEGFVRVLEM